MNKKTILVASVLTLMLPALAEGAYERAFQIRTKNVLNFKNHFELHHQGENYMIHHERGCGDIGEDQPLTMILRDELDGINDRLFKEQGKECKISQAEKYNKKLYLAGRSLSTNKAEFRDENGELFRLFYPTSCENIRDLGTDPLYVFQYGFELGGGDRVFLPGNEGRCTLNHVQRVEEENVSTPDPFEGLDQKRPTTPTNLKAIPQANSVFLSWDESSDDEGIAEYIVSYALYHTEDARARDLNDSIADLPNQIRSGSSDTSMSLQNLESDEQYFFRVIAVDTSGNKSSYWSQEATAMTRSSIAERNLVPEALEVELIQENERHFHYRWQEPGNILRRHVELMVDGEVVYKNNRWPHRFVRVLKTPSRRGKKLSLKVETTDIRGLKQEDIVHFEF